MSVREGEFERELEKELEGGFEGELEGELEKEFEFKDELEDKFQEESELEGEGLLHPVRRLQDSVELQLQHRRASRRPTLAGLQSFTRRFVRRLIAVGRRADCADLAIEIWIYFGAQYGLPVSFRIWDARGRRWLVATRTGVRVQRTRTLLRRFGSTAEFLRFVQSNLGAQGLVDNTYPVRGGHRNSIAGDVFLWRYTHATTGRVAGVGHTQIFDRLLRARGGPMTDRIQIVQGNLPPEVPRILTKRAAYFYRPRRATIGRQLHYGRLVGSGPRRFIGFRSLR
jgi:hypothetical protein